MAYMFASYTIILLIVNMRLFVVSFSSPLLFLLHKTHASLHIERSQNQLSKWSRKIHTQQIVGYLLVCEIYPHSIFIQLHITESVGHALPDHVVNSHGAFEFPLFHRDHPCVQQHYLGHRRSSGNIVEKDLPLPIDLIRNDSINNFLFLMPIKLGTPPVWNLVAVDTGASLSFVQCEPCTPVP